MVPGKSGVISTRTVFLSKMIRPIPAGSEAFNKAVSKYTAGKGTIQFPLDQPLPLKLIRQVVKYRVADQLKNQK